MTYQPCRPGCEEIRRKNIRLCPLGVGERKRNAAVVAAHKHREPVGIGVKTPVTATIGVKTLGVKTAVAATS